MLLKGWLQFDKFTVSLSENEGWSLFEPLNYLLEKDQG